MALLSDKRDLDDVITTLLADPRHEPNITRHHVRTRTEARWGEWPEGLHTALSDGLRAIDIQRPYTHQAEAVTRLGKGEHIVLTTPTASGKSLCYNVPVLDRILKDPAARALYIFPTKALSQDQYTGLHGLIGATGAEIGTFTFDGDTPPDARRAVRDHGQIVITNPDMLHSGILPQHTKWLKLFENLAFVVIDELHTYRGIFGSHVANLLRRLRRICAFYGSDPQFVLCSATIANPVALGTELTGLTPRLIDNTGAPTGSHHMLCYNPPVVNAELGIRAGVIRTSTRIATELVTAGISTIIFAGSRLHVEIILKYLRQALAKADRDPQLVQGYRGGYLPNHRRRIEAGLRDGSVQAVVATNALELGIDIGSLQACIIAGYPGSIASLWQQSGRAGRRSGKALSVFVARSSALDQYLVTHPEVLLEASPEHARLNPRNLFVLVDHMKCAAFELPFEPQETYADLSANDTEEVLSYLETHGVVHKSTDRYHWMARVYPASHVNLRGIDEENFVVIDIKTDRILAEVDFRSAHTSLYEHAIYNVDAAQYQVERLDYENHKAFVRRVEPDYYTTAMTYSRVGILEEDESTERHEHTVAVGDVLVTRKFVGFKKLRFHTHENVGYGDIELPDLEKHTTACWLTLAPEVLTSFPFDRAVVLDGLVGLSHALHTTATVFLMCTSRDLGRVVGDKSAETALAIEAMASQGERNTDFEPTLFLYDAMPGGVGLAGEIFKHFPTLLARARGLLRGCDCQAVGCPACLGPMSTYEGPEKQVALALAERLLAPKS